MKLYLVTWPPEVKLHNRSADSRWVTGGQQWEVWRDLAVAIRDSGLQLRLLLSYWYYKDLDLDKLLQKYFGEYRPELFADSGAFTAMTTGAAITPQEYAAWIKRWGHLFTSYANLDVIKDAQGTWDNQRRLEDMGLKPLPCFHVLEDFSWLEKYLDQAYPYICLGVAGMHHRLTGVMPWLVRCFKLAQGKAVFHGFALTAWKVMSSFPWYSVDSSAWARSFRFGMVPVFNQKTGVMTQVVLGDRGSCYAQRDHVRAMGMDVEDFADRSKNSRARICSLAAVSYMLAERYLSKRHGHVLLPGTTKRGLKLYLSEQYDRNLLRDLSDGVMGYLRNPREI